MEKKKIVAPGRKRIEMIIYIRKFNPLFSLVDFTEITSSEIEKIYSKMKRRERRWHESLIEN